MQISNEGGRKSVAIVYFDAASGHRSAAAALQKAFAIAHPAIRCYTINITDIFDHHQSFGKLVRSGISYFNWQIKRDKVFDLRGLINLSLLCHDLVGNKGINKIAGFWKNTPPDGIISVTPMYNPVLFKSAKLANPAVTCITIPVDFEEVCKRYWFTPKVEQYYFNATEVLEQQALAAGVPQNRLFRLQGMPVDPDAYHVMPRDKATQLADMGFDTNLPTGFLSFGGQGTSNVMDILEALTKLPPVFNMIVMCGKNKKLFNQINLFKTPFAKAVFDYLPQTPINYLHLADFALGKPGAMTITEAVITGTPLIALKSKGMSPVQKGNEDWMTGKQVGIVAENPKKVADAVMDVLADPRYKKSMNQYYHRSVFDIANNANKLIDATYNSI